MFAATECGGKCCGRQKCAADKAIPSAFSSLWFALVSAEAICVSAHHQPARLHLNEITTPIIVALVWRRDAFGGRAGASATVPSTFYRQSHAANAIKTKIKSSGATLFNGVATQCTAPAPLAAQLKLE